MQPAVPSAAGLGQTSGGFQFTVEAGAPGTVLIQATTNPADVSSWATIGSIPPLSSTSTFTDTNFSQYAVRFYRGISP